MLGELGKICAAIPVKNLKYALEQFGIAFRDGAELIEWRLDLNEEKPYNPLPMPELYTIPKGLEFARTKLGAEVIEDAKKYDVKVIVSKHGQKMPETAEIIKIFEEEKALGANIAKAAFRAENLDDVAKMKEAAWYDLGIPQIAIAMGKPGEVWRVISLLGCYLNYFAVGEATAPGQLSVREGVVNRGFLQDAFYKIH